jgi:hypothetical protein
MAFRELCAVAAVAMMPPIGVIDFYGLHRVTKREVRAAIAVHEGDSVPDDREATVRRIEKIAGVETARLEATCCERGKVILWVGIQEKGAVAPRFHRKPDGSVRLPDEITAAGREFETALDAAVRSGNASDDSTQGHSLISDPTARAIQLRFVTLSARHLDRIRDVLRHSSDDGQRALAAQVIAYAPDKRKIVSDLVEATADPSPDVRNSATRALMVLAMYAQTSPRSGISIPWQPFVAMLSSIDWTDRNKAAGLLMQLTVNRDASLLTALHQHALPELIEMARWKVLAYATPSLYILGRMAGVGDEAIQAAIDRGDRDAILRRFNSSE